MRNVVRRRWGAAVIGLSVCLPAGCQTWMAGMTLPSPHYLEQHPPQYFPQEPDFPLPREQGYQEEAAGLLGPGGRDRLRDGAGPAPVGAAPPVPAPAIPGVPPKG